MKSVRTLLLALSLAAAASPAFSQESKAGESEAAKEREEEARLNPWKWANFVLLAAGIGYLIGKNAGPMFAERSKQIRKDIIEADEARREAEERALAVERRLDNLETEIAALREEAAREGQAETQRLAQHTAAEMAKVQANAEQEIAAAGKAARMELKQYTAELAVTLAERKIRDRMTPQAQDALVQGFVRDLQ